MANPALNKLNGHVWFHCTGNTTISLSDLSANAELETVSKAYISKLIFTGPWDIYRGANAVWHTANTSFEHDFAAKGASLVADATGNIVCNTASASASLMICLSKVSSSNGSPVV